MLDSKILPTLSLLSSKSMSSEEDFSLIGVMGASITCALAIFSSAFCFSSYFFFSAAALYEA